MYFIRHLLLLFQVFIIRTTIVQVSIIYKMEVNRLHRAMILAHHNEYVKNDLD
jgi:hypothetical protein